MPEGLFDKVYNPDVLSCLANLSSDEVFTPPEIANEILDLLPQELFESSDTTFLDPACKSGVFLREIAKRLLKAQLPGYEDAVRIIEEKRRNNIPLDVSDEFFEQQLQDTVDHIFHKQLYGIAITELTSLLSRRSVYCSKYPNGQYSITHFNNPEGNIRFRRIKHRWKDGRCEFCGAAQSEYDRADELETHAYELIHTKNPEDIFDMAGMKFDVVISNPPYQLDDGGNGKSAKPIYNLFVSQAKKLNPSYLAMIIPSRWFSGGKGLDKFRSEMLNDTHITHLVDYQNAKDCFPGVSLGGGVCYFLWEKSASGSCSVTNIVNGHKNTMQRPLNEYPVFIRYNDSIDIIKKVQAFGEESIVSALSSRNPFGIATNERGIAFNDGNSFTLYSSQGKSYISKGKITQGTENAAKYKIMISRVTSEHAGEPDKTGMYKIIAKMQILMPYEVCTDSYIIAYPTNNIDEIKNVFEYLRTKFVRFLILQSLSSINLSRDSYSFVPAQDFKINWTDAELYKKYNLSDEEIELIETTIKPIDGGEE